MSYGKFAPSKDDVIGALMHYFGAPASPDKLKDYQEHHAATYHFPDAFAGSNVRLREVMSNLILRSPQVWQTTIGLPFQQIEGTTVEWDEIHFDVRLLQRVPYEGVSRMQTSLRRKHRDRVVRRGLGMMIESDFYATEAGRQHFKDSLTSIRYCVQETCNFDVLYSYLTTSNYDFAYDMTRKARPAKSVKTALNHEIMMYAVCQKEPLGLDKAVEEIRFRMSRYNVRPNMMVIPPQLALYMALAPEPKTLYTEGGPKADAQFEAGYEGFESRSFRGLTVVTSEPFEVAEDQESVQMLTRNTQVGEHYIMKPPEPGQKIDPEQRGFCDIVIYDEEGDQHVRMSWSDAVKATCASELIGNVVGATGPTVSDGTNAAPNLKEWLEHAVAWAWLNENGYENKEAPPVDWAKKFGDNFGLDDAKIKAKADEVKKNGRKRVQIVLARPFIEHEMHSAVVAVAGKDTGCTLFGPSDMQIAANIQVKTIEGHYTCHVKSVVSKPQNVFVARDVCCAGYVAGGNVGYFTKGRNGQCSMIEGQKNLTERLGVNSGMTDYHPSLFAFPSMEEHTIAHTQMDTVMSLTGRMLPWNTSNPQDDAKDKFPGGKEMFDSYKKGINFGSIHYGEDGQASRAHAFVSAGSVNNSLCFRGPHRVFNPYSTKIMNLVPGLGHFGPDAIPGDARWRRGESTSLKAAREAMVQAPVVPPMS